MMSLGASEANMFETQSPDKETVSFICEDYEFELPKKYIYQSPVLTAAFDRGFKESSTGILEIKEFDSETVDSFVEFLKTGQYAIEGHDSQINPDTSALPVNANQLALRHILVNQIADYYDVEELQYQAANQVDCILREGETEGFIEILKVALSDSIADRRLCKIIVNFMTHNGRALIDDDEFDPLQEHDGPHGFAGFLIRKLLEKHKQLEKEYDDNLDRKNHEYAMLQEDFKQLWLVSRDLEDNVQSLEVELEQTHGLLAEEKEKNSQ